MPETVSPEVEYQLVSEHYGRFVVEPLESGFGLTLGNAMRRVLLSSLPGAAITAVKIDGVHHEFSTIPNMKEDTLEFLLNVKGIRLRALSDRSDTMTLEVSGEKKVRAKDIKSSAAFEIVNPEHHLATLDAPEANLNVEFTVEIGKGYITAGSSDGKPIGVLPIDAVFTPIRRVNYKVEKARVEDRSDYDRLILDVWSDGTISLKDAIAESARILIKQLSTFTNVGQLKEETVVIEETPPLESEKHDLPLEQLGLSSRTFNALRRAGILTVEILLSRTEDELLGLKNFGKKSWDEVREHLEAAGIELKYQSLEGELPTRELTPEELELEEMRKKLQEKFQVRDDK
ncbi:MAG: DNA-directed RNA polymerase subunit alpha [Chloroflexota bacterium]|nr:DNA-directed RNA polymerase subunit alpha [Chloroflexota bacterium]